MNSTTRRVVLVCVFSTLMMGCYSSTLIDPNGPEKGKMYSCGIESVVTKDGKKHTFHSPPDVDSSGIVGEVIVGLELIRPSTERVSIPLSDVSEVSVSEFSTWRTVLVGSAGLILILLGLGAGAAPGGGVSL